MFVCFFYVCVDVEKMVPSNTLCTEVSGKIGGERDRETDTERERVHELVPFLP